MKRILIAFATLWLTCGALPALAGEKPADTWQPPSFEIVLQDGSEFIYPADLEGPTIMLFWASWCPYCRALMPHVQSILDEFPGRVSVLAINFRDDDKTEAAAYLSDRGYGFRSGLEGDPVAAAWGVKATPGLFLVNARGQVVFSRGAIPKEAYVPDPGENYDELKHGQKAARKAPFWAARLRIAIDRLLNPE